MKKLAIATFAVMVAFSVSAEAKHHGKKHKANDAYSEDVQDVYVGDPRIIYHQIGTSGSQNGNTIIPAYDQPIMSQKPYEIRYEYRDFR